MQTADGATGTTTLTLPEDWKGNNGAVLVIVQDKMLLLKNLKRHPLENRAPKLQQPETVPILDPSFDLISQVGASNQLR